MALDIPGLEDLQEIGRGGFGIVYRAREVALDRDVAVKVLAVADLDPEVLRRFEREAQVLGRLSEHPHIVTVHATGRTGDGRPWVSMAYLPNGSLGDRLRADGPLDPANVAELGVHVAGALETAHRHDVLHRDVKPENILVTSYGAPALADFGIARMIGGTQTSVGTVTASLTHAAPETLEGASPAIGADVYALASTLFALLNGRPAFDPGPDGTLPQLLGAVMRGTLPDLTALGVPEPLAAVIAAGMAKDPDDRPASAAEFGQLLADAQVEVGQASTPMVVLSPGDEPTTAPAPRQQGPEDATRVHARSGPSAQTPGRTGPGAADVTAPGTPTYPLDPPPPAASDSIPAPVEPGGGQDPAIPPSAAGDGRSRRLGLFVGAGVAAALVVGIGFAMSSGGDDTPAEDGTTVADGAGGSTGASAGPLTPLFAEGDNAGEGRVLFRVEFEDTITGATTEGEQLYLATETQVQARTLEDGLTRWTVDREAPSPEPLGLWLADGVLYYADGDVVLARDVTTSGELGRIQVAGAPTVPHVTEQGVVLAQGGKMISRVTRDGAVLWSVEKPLVQGESYVVHGHLEGEPIVVTTDLELLGIEPETGEVLFAQAIPENERLQVAQGNGLVAVATVTDGQLGLQAHDAITGDRRWSVTRGSAEPAAVQLRMEDGVLVLADGSSLTGLDSNTGSPDWQVTLDGPVAMSTAIGRVLAVLDQESGPVVASYSVYSGSAACGPTPIGSFPEHPFVLRSRWTWLDTEGTLVALDPAGDRDADSPTPDCMVSWVYDLPLDANATMPVIDAADLGQSYVVDDNQWLTGFRMWDR